MRASAVTRFRPLPMDLPDAAGEARVMAEEAQRVVRLSAEALYARNAEHQGEFSDQFIEGPLRCAARLLDQVQQKLGRIETPARDSD